MGNLHRPPKHHVWKSSPQPLENTRSEPKGGPRLGPPWVQIILCALIGMPVFCFHKVVCFLLSYGCLSSALIWLSVFCSPGQFALALQSIHRVVCSLLSQGCLLFALIGLSTFCSHRVVYIFCFHRVVCFLLSYGCLMSSLSH